MTDHPTPERGTPQLSFRVPKVESRSAVRRRPGWRRWLRTLFLRGSRRPLAGTLMLIVAASQAGLITWLTLSAPADLPIRTELMQYDKLAHGLAFGWLAYWTMAGLHHVTRLHVGWTCFITVVAAGIGWGGAIEIAQSYTPQRHFDLMDLLANTVGAIIVTSFLVVIADPGHHREPRYIRTEAPRA